MTTLILYSVASLRSDGFTLEMPVYDTKAKAEEAISRMKPGKYDVMKHEIDMDEVKAKAEHKKKHYPMFMHEITFDADFIEAV